MNRTTTAPAAPATRARRSGGTHPSRFESLAFRSIIAALGALSVVVALNVAFGGIETLGWQGATEFFSVTDESTYQIRDSHFRFYGGIYVGLGLALILAATNPRRHRNALQLAFAMVFLGGLARLTQDRPNIRFGSGLIGSVLIELVLMPVLYLWLSRLTKGSPDATAPADGPDLSGFRIAHAGFRQEFGLLAAVLSQDLSQDRARLADEQIAMVIDNLRRHDAGQRRHIRRTIIERSPESAGLMRALEEDFDRLAPVLDFAADTSVPREVRAEALARLHSLTAAYLDNEARNVIPLINSWISREEWAADGRRAMSEMPRQQVATIFGWFASAATPELRAAALSAVPILPRLLFTAVGRPAYRRRAHRLYGRQGAGAALRAT